MEIKRHSSHPEIWVGRHTTAFTFYVLSVVCLLAALLVLFEARKVVGNGNDRLAVAERKLTDARVQSAVMERVCSLAILKCNNSPQ